MNIPTVIATPSTLLHCGQCDDYDAPLSVVGDTATCTACGDVKSVSLDIARHIEPSESLVLTAEGHLAYVTLDDVDTED